jgi:pectate lyase-like protein
VPEGFANRYQTTLAAGVTSGAASGSVASATGIPAFPFRAIISGEGVNTDEIVLVTNVVGTTLTWTRAAEAIGGVQAASAHSIGATITAIVTAVGLLNSPGHFNIRAEGAVCDGVADDRAAIQSAIDKAVVAGGTVYLGSGTPRIASGSLDFSGMKGGLRAVRFVGAGAGDVNNGSGAATILINDQAVPAIKGYGTLAGATNQGIAGLELSGFMVKNLQNLGANYTIDLDYVIGMFRLADLFVWGQNFTGNGIQIRNFGHGQGTIERVLCREFRTGTGHRLAAEVTANVDVAPNSGNIALIGCSAHDVLKGYHVTGTNLINSGSLIACKAVNVTDVVGSIGFHFATGAKNWILTSPHAERFSTGYSLSDAEYITLLSPFASFPTGTPDANSAGIRMTGACTGNFAIGALLQLTHFGVSFEGTSRTNSVSGSDRTGARVLTAWSSDTSTNGSNHVLKTEGESPFAYTMGATKLSVAKGAVTGFLNPASIGAGPTQNWNPGAALATSGIIRITTSAAAAIGGMVAGTYGDELTLLNVSANTVTLNHEDAGSTAANRFFCPTSANFAIRTNGGVRLIYDTGNRWRVVAP